MSMQVESLHASVATQQAQMSCLASEHEQASSDMLRQQRSLQTQLTAAVAEADKLAAEVQRNFGVQASVAEVRILVSLHAAGPTSSK